MKKYLREDIEENTKILADFSKIITEWVIVNKKLSVKKDYLDNISGFSFLTRKYNNSSLFENNKQNLSNLEIEVFYNPVLGRRDADYNKITEGDPKRRVYGYFKARKNKIVLFYHDMQDIATNESQLKRLVKKTAAHEMRHFFQYSQYPEHFSADLRSTTYTERSIEIDAVFYEILANIDPYAHINYPQGFVKTVVDLLQQEKDLTPDQVKHYRNKAAAYLSKHIAAKLDDVWKNALTVNKKYLSGEYSMETFLSNVMDRLESYVQNSHFREMDNRVYMAYRAKTIKYYKEQTGEQRTKQQVNKLYSQLYPSFVSVMSGMMPDITNSRIGVGSIEKSILLNLRNQASAKGINTNTKIYNDLESVLKQKIRSVIDKQRPLVLKNPIQ